MSTVLSLLLSTVLGFSADPPAATAPAVRVAVLGDASTQSADRSRPFDGWPEQLGRMLGDRSEVVNCSRSGNRLAPGTRQFTPEMPEFREAEDARADVVVIAVGGADFSVAGGGDPESIRGGLIQVVEAMRVFRPEPRILLCIPPPPAVGPRSEVYGRALDTNAAVFAEFARERGLGLIDFRTVVEPGDMASAGMPVPSPDAATRMAAAAFRAITGVDPPPGVGPYRESFDASAYERRSLVGAGAALPTAKGWSAGSGASEGMLVNVDGAEALFMDGAIPEGPFRMRWVVRWNAGPQMAARGGPQFGAGGNWLSLDNRSASLQLGGPDIRGTPSLPATARIAPQGRRLEIELRRSQGVLEWRIDGQRMHAGPITSKALAKAGLDPMGARVELEAWTLDLPKP